MKLTGTCPSCKQSKVPFGTYRDIPDGTEITAGRFCPYCGSRFQIEVQIVNGECCDLLSSEEENDEGAKAVFEQIMEAGE